MINTHTRVYWLVPHDVWKIKQGGERAPHGWMCMLQGGSLSGASLLPIGMHPGGGILNVCINNYGICIRLKEAGGNQLGTLVVMNGADFVTQGNHYWQSGNQIGCRLCCMRCSATTTSTIVLSDSHDIVPVLHIEYMLSTYWLAGHHGTSWYNLCITST